MRKLPEFEFLSELYYFKTDQKIVLLNLTLLDLFSENFANASQLQIVFLETYLLDVSFPAEERGRPSTRDA